MLQSEQDTNLQSSQLPLWTVRLLFASLLLLGGEILLWNNPQVHDVLEWFIRIIAYIVSATLLLDLAVRYRIRNVYDVMTLMVVHVMIVALVIQPSVAFDEFPSKFIQRMMGGVGFVGIEMMGVFLIMTRSNVKRGKILLLLYAIAVGFYWGIWTRWTPLRDVSGIESTTFSMMLLYFGVVAVIVFGLFLWMSRQSSGLKAHEFQLNQRGIGLATIILLILFVIRLLQGHIEFGGLAIIGVLVAFAIGVLYYRKPEKAGMLMDKHIPPQPIHLLWLTVVVGIVALSAYGAYSLPFIALDFVNQLWILELAFLGIGGIWLPLIAVVFSTEAIDRQSRTLT